jgi:hypothetical protein
MELVTVSVELRYFPETETREALVLAVNFLRDLLLPAPLVVGDRFLTIAELIFDVDAPAMLCYFELEFMRETARAEKEYEKAENLEVKINCGTSASTD